MSRFSCLLIELHKKLLAMPMAALAICAVSVGSLITAFVAERFFGVEPCILCIYQRVPYALVIVLSLMALVLSKNDRAARTLMAFCAIAFFVNMGIAFFHSGVELHWWKGTDECGVNPEVLKGVARDVAAMRDALLKTPTVSCDAINFTFLGFTMANWNVLACFAFGLFCALAALGPCVNWANPSCSSSCCCTSKVDNKAGTEE